MAEQQTPTPVTGTVIETARGYLVVLALASGVLGVAAGFLLWDTWSHKDGEYLLPFHLAKDSLFTSFVTGLCAFGGVGCFVAFLCQALFPRQLILGDEVLQVTRPGGSTVETQIPYANIATVACERDTDGTKRLRVGIDLLNPHAPGTYARGRDVGKKAKNERDLYLPGSFTAGPEEIARLLGERCKKQSEEHGSHQNSPLSSDGAHPDANVADGKRTAGSSGAAYDQGLARLKRGEYAEAVAAFTEAIGINPEAPNAYLGRSLAYRNLGDDAAAVRDEQVVRALGGPERSEWDRHVKRAYRDWRVELGNAAWDLDDRLCRDAFLLHQWSGQIFNGGLPQWVANGYGEWAEDLARAAERVDTDSTRAVAAIVRDVARLLAKLPGAREVMFRMITTQSPPTGKEDKLFGELSRCEERYHRTANSFGRDVEAWFEKRAGTAM